MSRAPTAGDLVQIALAALRPGAAPAAPRPADGFSRVAVLQFGALACIAAALGCGALWIYAAPMLGAAVGLLVVSVVLCAVAFATLVVLRRAGDRRASSPPPGPASDIGEDALLAGGLRLFQQRPVVMLAAALLAGVLLGWEK